MPRRVTAQAQRLRRRDGGHGHAQRHLDDTRVRAEWTGTVRELGQRGRHV